MLRPREIASAPFESSLPLLAEGADFQLGRPGALRLLVKLPVGCRDRRRWHQQIGIVERIWTRRLKATLPHPFRVDAGVDDEVRDMDVLRSQFARHRLRDGTQTELS